MSEPKRPTWRARWLGQRLRELRKHKGFTAAEVGKRIEGSASTIARIESGEYPAKSHELTALMEMYGIAEEATRAHYMRLARDVALRGWWETLMTDRGFSDFVWAECHAKEINSFQLSVIPGLLQTRDYAKALIESGPSVYSDSRKFELLEARMARADVLHSGNPPVTRFLIHEAVFHQRIPGVNEDIYVDQAKHIWKLSQKDNLDVRVLPMQEMIHNSLGVTAGFTIVDVRDWPSLVHVETPVGAVVAENPEIDSLVTNYEILWKHALDEEKSPALIEATVKEKSR